MGEYVTERARELANLNIEEAAVPITFAYAREMGPLAIFNYFTNLTRTFPFREVRQGAMAPALVVREPIGVVGAVVPFNGPLMSAAAKIAPVLAAGCPIVFKPASETPLDVFVLADAAEAAGIPPGVLNIVPGDADVGAAVVGHPGIDRVLFTGSTTAGRAIAEASAGSMKRLTLELGGKAAAILLDDAPIEESLRSTLPMSFFNSGQACIALSRVLAPRDRYDEVVEAAVAITREMTLGDPHDESTVLGPVISSPPPRSGRVAHRCCARRRRAARDRRRAGRPRSRVVRGADDLRRRRQRHAPRAGRGVRPGVGHHPARR